MRKFAAGMVLGFLVSCSLTYAAAGLSHNGSFWNKLDSSAKSGYVGGYFDAMGVTVGKLDSLTIAAELFHWKGAKKVIAQLSRELSMSEMKPEEAVRKLDELYSNRKYGELDLGSALQLLTMRSDER